MDRRRVADPSLQEDCHGGRGRRQRHNCPYLTHIDARYWIGPPLPTDSAKVLICDVRRVRVSLFRPMWYERATLMADRDGPIACRSVSQFLCKQVRGHAIEI
jgi:hypothetical protein